MSGEKKTVGILSMQSVNNFGSLIQAYSLKKMVESLGHEVCFIDIERRPEDDALLKDHRISYLSEMESGSLKRKISDGYLANRFRNRAIGKEQDDIFNEFRDKYLPACDASCAVDTCIIGSDEVFNCLQESGWGFTSQLFGDVKNASDVITYAACCGFTKLDDVPDPVVEKIRDSFDNVSAFSVRDKNTFDFVSGITGSDAITYNLDPALLSDFDDEIAAAPYINTLPEKYCLVYAYKNRIYEKAEVEYIKSFCKARGMEIIAVGMPQMWIRNFYAASPFELLKIFRNAGFVITDTFHGTIFSARYADRFAVMVRESNKNKLGDLIGRLEIEDHVIHDVSSLPQKYELAHDKTRLNVLLTSERERSLGYLEANLND